MATRKIIKEGDPNLRKVCRNESACSAYRKKIPLSDSYENKRRHDGRTFG